MSDTRHLNFELETSIDHSGSGSSSTTSETNTESKTQTSQRPHVSTWAYIKWFIWSTIANLFGCSIPVFTSPYDNTWPTTSILIEPTELDYKDSKLCEINDAAAAADDSGDVPAAQLSEVNCSYEIKNSAAESSILLPSSNCASESGLQKTTPKQVSLSVQNHILEDSEKLDYSKEVENRLSLINGYFCDLNRTLNCNLPPTTTTSTSPTFTTTIDSELNHCPAKLFSNSENLCLEPTHPVTFTLLNSYHLDSFNGLIDEVTHDYFVNELINSVLPRNLSDSSELSVPVEIRKMYAWNKSTPFEPQAADSELSKSNAEMIYSLSDDTNPSPGHCSLSDHSYPPLSPSTLGEDSSNTGCFDKSPDIDLNLPDISRSDQTLAWTMSNLYVSGTHELDANLKENSLDEDTGKTSNSVEDLNNCEGKNEKISISGRPPVPNSLHRPSRDRSPAHLASVNNNRTNNSNDLSTFLPFEGNQLFGTDDTDRILENNKPKRSSSLKSSRSLSDTPVQKAVRFADALGLDLTTVRHVFDSEAPPKIPASATLDLQLDSDECIAKIGAKQFGMCFAQPGAASNFIRRVLASNVCLENCHIDMQRCVLTGTIRVKSLGYEKRVHVRITYNNWITFFDTPASYVQGSYDGVTDRFSFSLVFPDTMVPGDRAQFAIRYETHTGEQFWDNNHGQNYCVTCYAKATDLAGDGSWMHYL